MQSPKAFTISAHGAKMSAIGFGTMEFPQRPTELVAYAIECGYRLIDTARKSSTEERVGEGLGMAEIKVDERIALSFDQRRIHLFDGDRRRIAGAQ